MINKYIGELFKFIKRRLFTVIVGLLLVVYALSFFIKLSLPEMSKLPPSAIKELVFSNLYFTVLDTSVTPLLTSSFVIICSMIGIEYNANTFKTIAIRGTSKLDFINTKILAVLTFTTIFLMIGAFIFTILAIINQTKILGPANAEMPVAQFNPVFVIVIFFVFIISILPYLGLGLFLTLLTKSSGASIALGFVYVAFVENFLHFLISYLSTKFDLWILETSKFLLGSQIRAINEALLLANHSETEYLSLIYKPLLISVAYAIILYFSSILLMKKRDILN